MSRKYLKVVLIFLIFAFTLTSCMKKQSDETIRKAIKDKKSAKNQKAEQSIPPEDAIYY
ncbi:MAG: hypothetical protein JW871_05355 [Endomicrobiales bacterium]|nr:hypothetical protein [Endomicrobiales bacterium]